MKEQIDPDGVIKTYDYDANGNCTGFVLKRYGTTEISLNYVYDQLNRMETVKNALLGGAVIAAYTYDANGNRETLSYIYTGYQPGINEKIVAMAANASGIRDTSRVLGISQGKVMSTLKKRKMQ